MTTATTLSLVERTRAFLQVYDEAGLRQYLQHHWTCPGLVQVLGGADAEAGKVAAVCLAVLGDSAAVPALTAALRHEDAVVCSVGEFALWTIWFGQAGPDAERRLRGVFRMEYSGATAVLDELIEAFPEWAEAYNQRAIVNYRNHRFISAIDDCKEALALQEQHFGALAGLGHAYAQLGLYREAARCYQNALAIHPRMAGIRQALRVTRQLLRQSPAAGRDPAE